jgi:hypothetical protein
MVTVELTVGLDNSLHWRRPTVLCVWPDRISVGGEIFYTCPDRPWGPPSLLYNGYRVFPGGKAAGAWRWPPTLSSAQVKERVELYLYSTSGPSWPCYRLNITFAKLRQTVMKPFGPNCLLKRSVRNFFWSWGRRELRKLGNRRSKGLPSDLHLQPTQPVRRPMLMRLTGKAESSSQESCVLLARPRQNWGNYWMKICPCTHHEGIQRV